MPNHKSAILRHHLHKHGLSLLACLTLTAGSLFAQTNLAGWHRDGQSWLVWNDNLSFSGIESTSIYRSPTPINSLADLQAAERVGRLYPHDWKAARLQKSSPGSTWTIPDANGAPRQLLSSEGLFVHTPHQAGSYYFAVVKTENLNTGPFTSYGPIGQTVGNPKPHIQHTGFNGGHPYTVYSFWIDGNDDHTSGSANFPIMGSQSCNGLPSLYSVFEPQAGLPQSPMPAVVWLHGGGGSYWRYRPSMGPSLQLDLDVEDGLYVTPDEGKYINYGGAVTLAGARWFGSCEDFDRFSDVNIAPTAGTVVVNHEQRRINWIIDWLHGARGVDPARTSLAGLSMGGRGTDMFSRAYPERLAASLAFVAPTTWNSFGLAIMGDTTLNLSTTLNGNPGINEVLLPYARLSDKDIPFARQIGGTADTIAPWTQRPLVFQAWNDMRSGIASYWDGRGHTANSPAGWAGHFFVGSPKHAAGFLTRYRSDQSFPAFHDVDHAPAAGQQPHPGDPVVNANGHPHGTWGGWFDWSPTSIIDTPNEWSCVVWLETTAAFAGDNSPLTSARASVTLRRLQNFAASPHEVLWVELQNAGGGAPIIAMSIQADSNGVITIPDLAFGAAPMRLQVARGDAGGSLVEYGTPTSGCAGVANISGNQVPQVNTPGFALLHANAPASSFGIGIFSQSPQNATLFGINLHVGIASPAPIFLSLNADAVGSATTPIAIPNNPALAGFQLHSQAAWIDTCGIAGWSSSSGLLITIQP
jgi:hypothetical protein